MVSVAPSSSTRVMTRRSPVLNLSPPLDELIGDLQEKLEKLANENRKLKEKKSGKSPRTKELEKLTDTLVIPDVTNKVFPKNHKR